MIPVYVLDTSAWLKRYVQETGSERVDEIFADAAAGKIELCLLPIVYYELEMRLQRVRNTLQYRSSPNPPPLRILFALLDQELQNDVALCKPAAHYFSTLPDSLHLFQVDMRVPSLIRYVSVGANDALILVCLEELAHNLLQLMRPLHFLSADGDLAGAASAVRGLNVEFLPP